MEGLQGTGDTPVTAYHNTSIEAGEKILREGFKSGNSRWNYFMTNASGTKAGSEVARLPLQYETSINTIGAQEISYNQWRTFFNEAKIDLGLEGIENMKLSKEEIRAANAIRNQKAIQFMNQAGGDIFVIKAESGSKSAQKFIVLSDKAVEARVEIKSILRGQQALLEQMEKTVLAQTSNINSSFSRASLGNKMFRYGRLALRFAGETLLIEGTIHGLRQKHESAIHYVQRKSLNGRSPFENWMTDTYTDVGLYYWYKYSIDLDKK